MKKSNEPTIMKIIFDLGLLDECSFFDDDEYWQDVVHDTLFNYYSTYADIVIEDVKRLLLDGESRKAITNIMLFVSQMASKDEAESSVRLLESMLYTMDLHDGVKAVENVVALSESEPYVLDSFIDYVLMDDVISGYVSEEWKRQEKELDMLSEEPEDMEESYGKV